MSEHTSPSRPPRALECPAPAVERESRGSALLIVMAFIVIISVVLLAYMARTQLAMRTSESSAAIVEAGLLAEIAEAAILSDLRQEMLAGSTNASAPTDNTPLGVTNAWAMVPGRVLKNTNDLSNTNFLNLIKQSAYNRPFYPGNNPAAIYANKGSDAGKEGRARAINVSTAAPSKNGRLISAARWNQPMLLGGAGFTSTNQLPDWILITRNGAVTNGTTLNAAKLGSKDPANKDFVIGRFAYNIYDIGGLLDINVAGFPSNQANAAAKKGSMAWADLTAIPGVTDVNALVEWRNKASRSDYLAMVQGRELNSTNSEPRPWGEAGGFQKPYSANGTSDNRFFTRQDLLKYAKTYASAGLNTNALPFLTTFSADLDQPSFTPHPNRQKIQYVVAQGGNDHKGKEDAANPSLLTLSSTGEPVVKRRFPLDRLKNVVYSPPNNKREEIWNQFGLVWSESDFAWIYTDSYGSTTPARRIKNLSEITDREPNFVELMKAAINVGSLGGQFQNDNPEEPLESPRTFANGQYGIVDNHIMQIVANVIDQYDSDSYPTRIFFNENQNNEPMKFYGIEDLPYLYVIRNAVYRKEQVLRAEMNPPPPLPEPAAPWRCVMMFQPTLWNPHAPNSEVTVTAAPTEFRITADSQNGEVSVMTSGSWWENGWKSWAANPTPETQPDPSTTYSSAWVNNYPSSNPLDQSAQIPTVFDPSTDVLTFRTEPTGKAAFREPYTLTSPNYPPGSNADGYVKENVLPNEEPNEELSGATTPANQVIGFRVGILWGGPAFRYYDTSPNSLDVYNFLLRNRIFNSGGIDFELQFRAPNGSYYAYDAMEAFASTDNPGWHDDIARTNRSRPILRFGLRMDPRTQRYGFRDGNAYAPRTTREEGKTTDAYRHWLQGQTAWYAHPRNTTGMHFGKPGNGMSNDNLNPSWSTEGYSGSTYYYWNLIAVNHTTPGNTDDIHYKDPDGIVRPGMAAYFNNSTVGLPFITSNNASRPVILNRPFRSVAELAYASRGQPWKQLDFWTPYSADAALLDVFCISEPADDNRVVSGKVNLNTRRPEVLQALLRGVSKAEGSTLSASEEKNVAERLVAWTKSTDAGKGPLKNRSELVAISGPGTTPTGFSSEVQTALTGNAQRIQIQRQSVMRALADAGTTRTWSFLIDLIVQEGRYPENASAPQQSEFIVQGEQRYWIHLSIDRFTGKVTSKLIEAVND